ncbi:hypothetical protein R5R35_008001 [Gryllus longicercus]|uniref:Ig-like and fibronectin type-III domain-containing protein C25G4.10 n=1 Tax=Gryllus longicercus TaxID=2509291 RepID=A0AAN9Z2R8_9ORTH
MWFVSECDLGDFVADSVATCCRRRAMQLQLLVIAAWAAIASGGLPSVRDSLTHPVHVYEGDDALVTCVVRDAGDNTVLWKKEDRERHSLRVLTAGEARVTADRRFDVLHDAVPPEEKINSGGDVWVLVIKETKAADAGIYVCEVNSNPVVRSFHKLSVLSRALQPPPENGTGGAGLLGAGASDAARSAAQRHNYTACCAARNVSAACFGFCAVQSILQGNTGQDPERCEKDFPDIVRCMADGRNHVPCCARQRVPDICQDVCRGEYTVITDNIKTHFSCAAYTEPTLACIAEGVELLPSPPEDVEAAPLTEHSLNVSWAPPRSGGDTVNSFVVTVRLLRSFDEDGDDGFDAVPGDEEDSYAAAAAEAAESRAGAHRPTAPPTPEAPAGPAPPPGVVGTVSLTIPGTYGSTIVNDLQPFAMYEIAVVARNLHGESLPSEAVRALTLAPADAGAEPGDAAPGGAATPPLPDVRGCCTAKGVREASCVTKLCDPAAAAFVAAPDLMVCAPWAADAFSCLANGLDHSPCCRSRGLPDSCLVLCTGNVTQIDFSYFNCLKHLPAYASCLLRGYGVLPSSPRRVHVSHVDSSFALVHWAPPAALADTVLDYALHWRPLSTYDNDYRVVHARRQPFVLEGLRAGADYEVYVEAVNGHGAGDPSPRVVFRTHSQVQVEQEEASLFHNATACCVAAGLSGVCMPLCSYDARMGDVKALAGVCAGELHKLLRCGAGGRDHAPCCARRGVPAACAPVCAGVLAGSLAAAIAGCAPYIGNIVQCFEEGAGLLPGPVEELHATSVRDGAVTLAWQPPADGSNVTFFVVHYQKADNTTAHETLPRLQNQVNVTDPTADIEGLESGALYSFFVVSQNAHGASLPSSVLLLNATHTETDSPGIAAVPSPPHSLAVSSHSATWLTVSWQPPEFSLPSERLSYKLYHKSASDGDFQLVETSVTSHMLETLLPNTQYIVYVVAVSQKGASLPSETLIAWTDPAYPAFVEPPTVHPINLVTEGGSMTVLCIAMGTPTPTISLYITGRLVRQEVTRHMVTVVHNVTRDMDQIACYADNGYGTPMQASRKITVSHPPHITASVITMAAPGDSVALECRVEAQPEPKMVFWKDHNGRIPVIQGGRYDIAVFSDKEEESVYVMRLTIHKVEADDASDYFCRAENAFGDATQPVSLRVRSQAAATNVTACCVEQNVSSSCMDACSFYLDVEAAVERAGCAGDLDKLLKCAADGSDHRGCCAKRGVPRRCLDWCRGEPAPAPSAKACVLQHTKPIVACFHEGRERLPGPPLNVRVEVIDAHSVRVRWDPPAKNPGAVEMYRVFWRTSGARTSHKNDTRAPSLRLSGLKEGVAYECAVKAGNRLGTSALSAPVLFATGGPADKYITSAASVDSESSRAGVAVGAGLALVSLVALAAAAVWWVRRRRLLGSKSQGGVAFENPSYLREMNMDHIQIPSGLADGAVAVATSTTTTSPSASAACASAAPPPTHNGSAVGSPEHDADGGGGGVGAGWRTETLHVPAHVDAGGAGATAGAREELRLSRGGAGFKRLK